MSGSTGSPQAQSNGLGATMGERNPIRSLLVNHNRDLKSKEEKIDWRARPAMSLSNGLRSTMEEESGKTRRHGDTEMERVAYRVESRKESVPRRFQWYIAEGMFSLPATKYSMVIRFSVVR